MSFYKTVPSTLEIELTHLKQRYNWDCGVSCVIMVLPFEKRTQFLENFNNICQEGGFNKSAWTIDLCYLLKRFGIEHIYYTTILGVNPDFKCMWFYRKILSENVERVKNLFETAKENGLSVQKKSVSMSDIIMHLKEHGPIIVLVNANYLTCYHCVQFKFYKMFKGCLPWQVPYLGHYIVICGYSLLKKQIFYRNPSLMDKICVTSFNELLDAHKCYGTDEDVIFVYLKNKF